MAAEENSVVCENLTGGVRKIKREMTDEAPAALANGIRDETGMDPNVAADEPTASVPAESASVPKRKRGAASRSDVDEGELWDQMAQILNDPRSFVLNEANKRPCGLTRRF